MRAAWGVLGLATVSCNALVGYDDFTRVPNAETADGGDTEPEPVVDAGAADARPPSDRGCDLSQPFGAPVALPGPVNSSSFEAGGSLTSDELTIVFTRGLFEVSAILIATRPSIDAAFGEPTTIPALGTGASDFAPAITPDGLTIYFSRFISASNSDILTTTRPTKTGAFAAPLTTLWNKTTIAELAAGITADGAELFYSTQPFGAASGIARATRDATGSFVYGARVPELESTADDHAVTFTADGLTIYFGSSRPGGKGLIDVWTAKRPTRSSPFSAPVPVPEVSTPQHDAPSHVSADGCRLYLNSGLDQTGGLFVATKPPR